MNSGVNISVAGGTMFQTTYSYDQLKDFLFDALRRGTQTEEAQSCARTFVAFHKSTSGEN
jgi:hypothetical protein